MSEEFGDSYSEILRRDLHLQELADRTPNQALADGEEPREIWLAICRSQQIPKSRWTGQPIAKRKSDTQ